jgi:nuclear pore complex protein Nup210
VEANHPEIVAVHVDSQLVSEGEIQVTKTQVLVKALKQGTALVRVHLASDPDIADFLLVRVGAYVSPREPVVHLGSTIGFTAGMGGSAGGLREEGRWSSGDAGVVRIDPFSGEATAVGPGTTTGERNGMV